MFNIRAVLHIKSAVYSSVCEKLQNTDIRATPYVDVGYIVNNITSDIMRLYSFTTTCQQLVTAPLLLVIFTIILISEIGVYSLGGIVVVVLLLMLTILIGKLISKATEAKLRFSGQRNAEVTFALSGIKSIKFNCWEDVMFQKINNLKNMENKAIFILNCLANLSNGLNNIIPTISGFITIVLYNSIESNKLSLAQVFFILSAFSTLSSPLKFFYYAYQGLEQVKVSTSRIQKLINLPDYVNDITDESLVIGNVEMINCSASYKEKKFHEEITKESLQSDQRLKKNFSYQMQIKGNSFYMFKLKEEDFLSVFSNIDIRFKPGSLTMIIGKVGSGKSSILRSLTNELHIIRGSIKLNGKIAYLPQESFLINDTVQNNITLGSRYCKEKFEKIIKLCELVPDLNSFKAGKFTEIGENGINISGGQKQRISIARALYIGADIFLIDDAFSALDGHVGKKIFNNVVIKELVNKGKTVIMTTHVLSFIEKAHSIIFLEKGKISCKGKYRDLIKINDFNTFIQSKSTESKQNEKSDQNLSSKDEFFGSQTDTFDEFNSESKLDDETNESLSDAFNENAKKEKSKVSIEEIDLDSKQIENKNIKAGKIIKTEPKEIGNVGLKTFWKYFTSGGTVFFIMVLVFFMLVSASSVFSEYWISAWTSDLFNLSNAKYIGIYGGILGFMFVVNIITGVFFGWYAVKVGFQLFSDLLRRIIKKPMAFFDTTPVGQLLNLMGKDSDYVDTFLANYTSLILDGTMRLVGIFVLIGIANFFLIPITISKLYNKI